MAGIEAMHTRFGRLPFKDLFQPAIWYAQHGVVVSPLLNVYFRWRQSRLWRTPEGRRFASMESGLLPSTGDRFVQTELAGTLQEVAAQGASYMYTGDWGHRYVTAIRAEGGKITLDDMDRYKPIWRDPLSVRLANVTVFGPGESDNQNCPTLEALNLLNALRVDKQGPYWRDPSAFATYASALRFALYGRYLSRIRAFERNRGFSNTCKARISPRYATSVVPHLTQLLKGQPATSINTGSHSAAVVVIDRWGNVAALVHSINAVVWGTTGIVVGGIPIPDAASINKSRLVRTRPGDNVANDMEPLIALQQGKPVLAIATVGASLVPENTRLIGGLLLNRLKLPSLVAAPPLLLNTSTPKLAQRITEMPEWIPAGTYGAKVVHALSAEGIQTEEESPEKTSTLRGTAAIGIIDSSNGERETVEVPGVMGAAEAR